MMDIPRRRYFGSTTLGAQLEQSGGVTSGFDFLRLALALFILYSHSAWILTNATPIVIRAFDHGSWSDVSGIRSPFRTLSSLAVPMFFALSGFLVAASSERNRHVGLFLSFRALRIVPALFVEVMLSAFVLGPLLSEWNWGAYFSSLLLYEYILNIFGLVSFYLPGLFLGNPVNGIVNINLWTLPAEFYCYLILAALMATTLLWRKMIYSAIFVIVTCFLFIYNIVLDKTILNGENFQGFFVVYYFFVGVFFYVWRDRIAFNIWMFLGALAASLLFISVKKLAILSPFFLVYVTVAIGVAKIPMPEWLRKNDYSYGIYLYGFPIAQSLYLYWPKDFASVKLFQLCAILLTFVFAALSWRLFERRALAAKPLVKAWFSAPKPLAAIGDVKN